MQPDGFIPHVRVLCASRTPRPILPINYGWFVRIELPDDVPTLSFSELLTLVKVKVVLRGFYRHSGPFGRVFGHAVHSTPTLTVYLNRDGDFAPWHSTEPLYTGTTMPKRKPLKRPQLYVIGRSDEEFTSLVPLVPGEEADDRNTEAAMTFTLLSEALEATQKHAGNVFELVKTRRRGTTLRELKVDLNLVNRVPFDGSYRIGERLIVGPSFVCPTPANTEERVRALEEAGVVSVISLLDRAELGWMRRDLDRFDFESRFQMNYLPVADGQAPPIAQTKLILDQIDGCLGKGETVFLHCVGGRGRSGTVAGCLLARQGVAIGFAVLNKLAEIRYAHGLFKPSPENEAQRRRVVAWRAGE